MTKLRRLIQTAFLITFVLLIIIGKVQAWMLVFLASFAASAVFGRFYCGFICPINTLIEGVEHINKRTGTKRKGVPNWAKTTWVRYITLLLFILTFVYVAVTGKRIPVLPILTGLGVAVSLYYVPALWHRYLCPYGTIMSITGSFAKHCWQIEKQSCIKCGACVKVCPADAVRMDGKESFVEIQKGLCLECTECAQICPKNAIKYK